MPVSNAVVDSSLEVEWLLWLESVSWSVTVKANCSLADYHAWKG